MSGIIISMENEQDKDLVCIDCGTAFVWTSGQQYFMKGLLRDGKIKQIIEPKRCIVCREKRTARILAEKAQQA